MSKNVFLGLIKVDKDRQIYDHPFVDFIKDKNEKNSGVAIVPLIHNYGQFFYSKFCIQELKYTVINPFFSLRI